MKKLIVGICLLGVASAASGWSKANHIGTNPYDGSSEGALVEIFSPRIVSRLEEQAYCGYLCRRVKACAVEREWEKAIAFEQKKWTECAHLSWTFQTEFWCPDPYSSMWGEWNNGGTRCLDHYDDDGHPDE